MKTDKNEVGEYCPLIKGDCIERKCKFYIKLKGSNPQNDADIDYWDCAISWIPILLIENSSKIIQSTASMDKVNNTIFNLSSPNAQKRIAEK